MMQMNYHFEIIICPECETVEVAVVKHTYPWWTYIHDCTKCGYTIMESEWNSLGKLINEDCNTVLPSMKNNSEGLVIITDPPYGVRKDEKWDNATLFQKRIGRWLNESLRIAEHTVVWFCANKMYPYIFRCIKPEQFFREHHWNKPKGNQFNGASNNHIWYSSEPILVFTNNVEKTKKNYDDDAKWNYDDLVYGTVAKKIWKHPTVKPVELMAELIMHYTKPSNTVLDMFGGSGSTAIAAIKTGRKFIYIEQDKQHFDTAIKRIKDLYAQNDLFGYKNKAKQKIENKELFKV